MAMDDYCDALLAEALDSYEAMATVPFTCNLTIARELEHRASESTRAGRLREKHEHLLVAVAL